MLFKANLGSDIVMPFKFINFVKKQIPYQISIEPLGGTQVQTGGKGGKQASTDFTADASNVNAPAADSRDGVEVTINVRFEPSTIEESRALLKVSSPEGGIYQCYLIGSTLSPQPKGPFVVSYILSIIGKWQRRKYFIQKSIC